MANIPIDKVFNQTVYAKATVKKLSSPGGSVVGTIAPGAIIGKIYSYVVSNGKVYWMIDDIFGSQTFFVEHNPNTLNLPNKQQILNDIAKQAEAQKLEDKGIIQYNIDKYLPWIIGAGIATLVLPTLLNNKISGVKKGKSNKSLLLIGSVAVAAYLLTRKKTKAGKPIIEVIDEGFVNEIKPGSVSTPQPTATSSFISDSFGNTKPLELIKPVSSGTGGTSTNYSGNDRIDFVGPFEVDYSQNMIAGKRKKGNLGKYTTC